METMKADRIVIDVRGTYKRVFINGVELHSARSIKVNAIDYSSIIAVTMEFEAVELEINQNVYQTIEDGNA